MHHPAGCAAAVEDLRALKPHLAQMRLLHALILHNARGVTLPQTIEYRAAQKTDRTRASIDDQLQRQRGSFEKYKPKDLYIFHLAGAAGLFE